MVLKVVLIFLGTDRVNTKQSTPGNTRFDFFHQKPYFSALGYATEIIFTFLKMAYPKLKSDTCFDKIRHYLDVLLPLFKYRSYKKPNNGNT